MNMKIHEFGLALFFLNGVCRHEHPGLIDSNPATFLNGVCRHERK